MPVQKTEKIWHNGKFINWDDAQLHVLSHVVSYGSGIFEGIRCYDTPNGPAIFRLREHMQRLQNSGKIYRMELPFSANEFSNAACELVRLNKMGACYVKPIVLRGYGEVGVNPLGAPIECYIACWSWGAYLERKTGEGVDVCVNADADRSQHAACHVQSRSELHELAVDPHGSCYQWIQRGRRARLRRPRQRRLS
jgi:branched-chain amino acid aminotransferase